jgi:hypothetical protein
MPAARAASAADSPLRTDCALAVRRRRGDVSASRRFLSALRHVQPGLRGAGAFGSRLNFAHEIMRPRFPTIASCQWLRPVGQRPVVDRLRPRTLDPAAILSRPRTEARPRPPSG